jgi:hypothetical protein
MKDPFFFGASALDFCIPYSPFVSSLVLFRLLFSVTLDAVEASGKRSLFLFDDLRFLELCFSFFLSGEKDFQSALFWIPCLLDLRVRFCVCKCVPCACLRYLCLW